ncbi:MAG: alanine racemase [Cohaesibacter sp.]|nr:alanine racemase [Cohaesibacter sp.]
MTAPNTPAPSLPLAPNNEAISGASLNINLAALQDNYTFLASKSSSAQCAAVIKADGYGIGLEQAATSLWDAGCRTFFVAVPQEGIRTRAVLEEATIYVLNGLFGPDCPAIYAAHELRPVIGSLAELEDWQNYCKDQGRALACALHFDTGMNRLGMGMEEAQKISQNPDHSDWVKIALIMSHLACGDEPMHPLNTQQLDRFRAIRALFADIPASFANSAGIFLGPDYHFDLLRPGIALYGGQAVGSHPNPMQCVATMKSRILDIRYVPQGHSISYGAAQITKRDSRIGILSIGYADGYIRAGGSTDAHTGAHVWLEGHSVPIFGRVTMDLIMVDLTDLPVGLAKRGMWVELFGTNIAIDDVAASAGTIGYEMLTSLSKRALRSYLPA